MALSIERDDQQRRNKPAATRDLNSSRLALCQPPVLLHFNRLSLRLSVCFLVFFPFSPSLSLPEALQASAGLRSNHSGGMEGTCRGPNLQCAG